MLLHINFIQVSVLIALANFVLTCLTLSLSSPFRVISEDIEHLIPCFLIPAANFKILSVTCPADVLDKSLVPM